MNKNNLNYSVNFKESGSKNIAIIEFDGKSSGSANDLSLYKEIQQDFIDITSTKIDGIFFDFKKLSYATSSFIGAIIRCYKLALENEIPCVVCNIYGEVKEIFNLLGCSNFMTITESFEAACEKI